jgi:hypothetical protein
LRQVGGFLRILQFPPPIKLLLKVVLNTIDQTTQALLLWKDSYKEYGIP